VKRILAPLSLFVLLAVALSACGVSATSGAATVNGSQISIAQLNTTIHDATSSTPFNCLLTQASAVKGSGLHATYSSRFVAQQLSLLVENKVASEEVSKLHLASSSLATTLGEEQIESGLTGSAGSACTDTGAQVLASLASSYQNLLLKLQVDQDLIAAHLAGAPLTNAGVEAFTTAHPNIADEACVSVILVAKRATAESIITKLKSGSSFSALAKSDSTDSTTAANGGVVGCDFPGEFSGTLAQVVGSIAVNTPSAPISFQSSYVVLEVTSRKAGTPAGAALALVSAESNSEVALVNVVSKTDKVWVNSQYGTWGVTSGQKQIVAPTGPLNTDLPNANAVTPPGDTYK
jgi:hypothetical protein